VSFTIPAPDYYGVAVWKRGSADLPLAGTYRLILESGLVGVEDLAVVPAATRLVGAHPNPFNPRTTVAFELSTPGPARLAIHDLAGARVRTLVDDTRPAGRQEVVWDGTDDTGRHLASGVYMVRLVAGPVHDVKKVVLVQ